MTIKIGSQLKPPAEAETWISDEARRLGVKI